MSTDVPADVNEASSDSLSAEEFVVDDIGEGVSDRISTKKI